jgi:succinate dehydrogenase/fumarate reductase flavoprotein subunit
MSRLLSLRQMAKLLAYDGTHLERLRARLDALATQRGRPLRWVRLGRELRLAAPELYGLFPTLRGKDDELEELQEATKRHERRITRVENTIWGKSCSDSGITY